MKKINWRSKLAVAHASSSIVNEMDFEEFSKLDYKSKMKVLKKYEEAKIFNWSFKDNEIPSCPSIDTCELVDSFLEKEITEAELWENYRKMEKEIVEKEKFILDWKIYIKNMEEDLLSLRKSKDDLFNVLLHM